MFDRHDITLTLNAWNAWNAWNAQRPNSASSITSVVSEAEDFGLDLKAFIEGCSPLMIVSLCFLGVFTDIHFKHVSFLSVHILRQAFASPSLPGLHFQLPPTIGLGVQTQ